MYVLNKKFAFLEDIPLQRFSIWKLSATKM